MSLEVTPDEIKRAEHGVLTSEEFIHIIKRSLPEAWEVIHNIAHTAVASGHAAVSLGTLSQDCCGQLLRMIASTSMRNEVMASYAGSPCVGTVDVAAIEIIDGTLMFFLDTPDGRLAHKKACASYTERLGDDYPHVHRLAHAKEHQRNPDPGMLISEPAVLTENERRDVLRVMASSPLRTELARSFDGEAEVVFVNCHMMAILQYPSEEVRRRITSSMWQVLSQKPEYRHC